MHLMSFLLSSYLIFVGSVGAFSWQGDTQLASSSSEGDLSVPGQNPLYFCSETNKDLLSLEFVDLAPNPPQAGQTLAITAQGTLAEDIEEGATIHLQVKWNMIQLIKQDADLCETVKNVDLECPIKKGLTTLTRVVDLPSRIPPGKYTVLADVRSKNGDRITCLTAVVNFGVAHMGL